MSDSESQSESESKSESDSESESKSDSGILIDHIQSCSSEDKHTVICRGTYNNTYAFFKIFNIGSNTDEELSLIYESNVYKRIQESSAQHSQFFYSIIGLCGDRT